MKPSNASHGKFCPAMKKLREVEKLYVAKEKHLGGTVKTKAKSSQKLKRS
jgi:hypothetical protein